MANLLIPKQPKEISRLGVTNLRESYNKLASDYMKVMDMEILMCPKCGNWQKADTSFYLDRKYSTNRYPLCKRCILAMVEQREKDSDEPNETKESVQRVLQMMDRVYDDSFYEDCCKAALDEVKERNRQSPFASYFTALQSLPQYKGLTWKDSRFGDMDSSVEESEIRIIQKTVKSGRKRFGNLYTDEELQFLENEYQDWITRYECNTKAQEEVFENLSLVKLLKNKALKEGKPTKDLDAQQQNWMDTGNLKPKQNSMDTMSDAQTMGTLLQKYEETRPLPEIDPELQDVDKIGLYFDVFFRGHASKMLGIKNMFSNIYENYIRKYTVTKPEYDEEEDSEVVFEKVFGTTLEE